MSVPFNELPAPKLLDCPIHVHRRKAACIGDVLLCERNMEATIVQKTDELKPRGDLADKMSKSRQRFPGAKIFDPFAIDRRMNQRLPPKRMGERSGLREDIPEVGVRYKGNDAHADAAEIAIHFREVKGVQVGDVPRYIEGRYLSPIRCHSLARQKAAHHDCTAYRPIPLACQTLARSKPFDSVRHAFELSMVLLGQARDAPEARNEHLVRQAYPVLSPGYADIDTYPHQLWPQPFCTVPLDVQRFFYSPIRALRDLQGRCGIATNVPDDDLLAIP
ncbi:hypothetical protein ACVILK_003098 [Bradyrhizobium embrapense]